MSEAKEILARKIDEVLSEVKETLIFVLEKAHNKPADEALEILARFFAVQIFTWKQDLKEVRVVLPMIYPYTGAHIIIKLGTIRDNTFYVEPGIYAEFSA